MHTHTHQQVLVDLDVAVQVGQVSSSVQCSQAAWVLLVHLCSVVQQVVDLCFNGRARKQHRGVGDAHLRACD